MIMRVFSRTLDSALAGATEHLKVIRVPHEQHVATTRASTVDCAVQLKSPSLATFERGPCLHSKVSSWDYNRASRLASRKGSQERWPNVCRLVRFRTVVEDIARLLRTLRSMRGKRTNFSSQLRKCRRNAGRSQEEMREMHILNQMPAQQEERVTRREMRDNETKAQEKDSRRESAD